MGAWFLEKGVVMVSPPSGRGLIEETVAVWPAGEGTQPTLRTKVLATISENPGIHMSALRRGMGLAWGTVAYHVNRLSKEGSIHIHREEREVRLFPRGFSSQQMAWLSTSRHSVRVAILRFLVDAPGLRASEIATRLGRSPNVVRRHLQAMNSMGFVTAANTRGRRFYVSDAMPAGMDRFLEVPAPDPSRAKARRYNGQGNRERILTTIQRSPGIHASQLARATGIAWANLAYHLRVLQDEKAVAKRFVETRCCYFLLEMEDGGLAGPVPEASNGLAPGAPLLWTGSALTDA